MSKEANRNDLTLHAITIEEATISLNSDIKLGISIEKAKERLEHFGLNAITEAKAVSPVRPPAQAARINNTADGARSFKVFQRGGVFLLSICLP